MRKKKRSWYQKLFPQEIVEKKKYLEFFTALLSIPVLITVIILNLNSVRNLNEDKKEEDKTTQNGGGFFSLPVNKEESVTPSTTLNTTVTVGPCKKELGPVSIDSPEENEMVTDNPVYIIISYPDDEYCGAVWSYRINGGSWSDYDDKSIALYNLPAGKVKFELKAKSLVKTQEKTVMRNFTYNGNSLVTIMPTPTIAQQDQ